MECADRWLWNRETSTHRGFGCWDAHFQNMAVPDIKIWSQTSTSNRWYLKGGKTRYFRKTITDLGDHDKVSSRGRYPQFLWWCIGSLTCWTTAQKPITFKHDAKRILTFSLDGLQSVNMAFGKGVVVCCYGRCRKKNNKTLRMSEGKCRISPTKAPLLQTFKMAVHIWYMPRVSSEASYPQNGWSS